jgi:hypothetical protein
MPLVRKMTAEEIADLEQEDLAEQRSIAALYDDLLSGVAAGDDIELELDPDEQRTMVSNHLRAAAARHTPPLQLSFRRTSDPLLLRFLVVGPPAAPSQQPAAQPAAASKPSAPQPSVIDQSDLIEPQPLFLSQPQRRDPRRPAGNRYGTSQSTGGRPTRSMRGSGPSRQGSNRYGPTPGRQRPDGPPGQRDRRRPR